MIFFSLVPAIFFRARLQRTLASQIHAIMVVRVFWERKATSFAAVLQGLQARYVKASSTWRKKFKTALKEQSR